MINLKPPNMYNQSDNKRLAINTVLMYFRMFLIMGINLYASRVILHELGISDFGIYNIVNGIIVSFSFISTALTSAVQRFLAFALGRGDTREYQDVFSTSLLLFIVIGLAVCVILLPLGDWLISEKLVIPDNRRSAALVLFFSMIPNLFVSFIGIPFSSAVIAQERMSFFAYSGIVEALLKLGAVLLLSIIEYDKLITYGILLLITAVIVVGINIFYVTKFLNLSLSCRYKKKIIHEMGAFSSWTLFDALASIGKIEFVNFILNFFYGVTINAAVGIAKQINSAVSSFTSNFQTAFKPQITQCYAKDDKDRLMFLIFNTSKFSGILFFVVAIPLAMNMDYILHIWLGDVPSNASYFSLFLILSAGLEAISGPLWITGHAIGNIRQFQLITSALRLFAIPLVYFYALIDLPTNIVFSVIVLSDFFVFAYRVIYLKVKVGLSILAFIDKVILKLLFSLVVIVVLILCAWIPIHVEWLKLIISILISVTVFALLSTTIMLEKSQREHIKCYIKNKIYSHGE